MLYIGQISEIGVKPLLLNAHLGLPDTCTALRTFYRFKIDFAKNVRTLVVGDACGQHLRQSKSCVHPLTDSQRNRKNENDP